MAKRILIRFPVVPKLCLGMRLAKLCLANLPTDANPKSGELIREAKQSFAVRIPKRRLGTTKKGIWSRITGNDNDRFH